MSEALQDEILQNIRAKTTDELLAIWAGNDREQWSDATFEAIARTLSERGVVAPAQEIPKPRPPTPPRYKGVGGWLLLFCISLTILNPLATLFYVVLSLPDTSGLFGPPPALRTVIMIDAFAFLHVAVALFGIYAGIRLWRGASGAVRTARTFLWCVLAYAALAIFLPFLAGRPDEATIAEVVMSTTQSICYVAIWQQYLNKSERVRATYSL